MKILAVSTLISMYLFIYIIPINSDVEKEYKYIKLIKLVKSMYNERTIYTAIYKSPEGYIKEDIGIINYSTMAVGSKYPYWVNMSEWKLSGLMVFFSYIAIILLVVANIKRIKWIRILENKGE